MKLATVEAMMPELRGGDIYKTGRGKASNWPAAVSRACKDIQRQLQKKKKGAERAGGKSLHIIKATITIIDIKEGSDGPD
jgi:hypothetical protein